MVLSMTAFASRKIAFTEGVLRCDIKSVNQRYFEASFKVSENIYNLEYHFRDILRRKLTRGKIFCHLEYEEQEDSKAKLEINMPVLNNVLAACAILEPYLKTPESPSALELLKWPHMIKKSDSEQDILAIQDKLLAGFSETLEDFIEARHKEGLELKRFIEQRLSALAEVLRKIRNELPKILAAYRARLMERMVDMKLQPDSNRLEQEMVFIAQKMDIAEELDRLDTHVEAMRNLLKTGGVIGRHLDFLSQELNREANTLASKSVDSHVSQETVELKVLIEQIREQVQNIE